MDAAWTWLRDPGPATRSVSGGVLHWQMQQADLGPDAGAAGLPLRALPQGDYTVETRVSTTVPRDGCCQNYAQGGLVIYQDDAELREAGRHLHLGDPADGVRQSARPPRGPGYPTYGNSVGGPVGEWTVLRLTRTHTATENLYTASTSRDDGATWDTAGTWTTPLSATPPRLGLVSMAAAGFTTTFDYVRVYGAPRGHSEGGGGS